MEQEFKPHPVLINYEASSDGIVRNRITKKPIGHVSNMGYSIFGTTGGKNYLIHRIVYEAFYGLIKDGLVIDHKNGIKTDNCLSNLQAISQSENLKKGMTGNYSKHPRGVKSLDLENNEERIFQSMNAAGKYFEICIPSVRNVAENITQSAISKKNGNRIQFVYINH
jgi:hypothetical protein